jgi:predicted site-specific integrase-resolvase
MTNLTTDRTWLTPPQLAKRWGVSVKKVLLWINSGELRAVNMAVSLSVRPRYRIFEQDITAFEDRRSAPPVREARGEQRRLRRRSHYL